ncbi:type I methionyl aminopeptidase [Pasteuria penetrans]|uniref:type I methionyl aminopeptidase n=1 Tax=Pasteuria penetrans TaxID=86005 RepID=UPI000FAA4285|nr:type I methionyl aminopeptidase [Pasteuria penetrans]
MIILKSAEDLDLMRQAGAIVAATHAHVVSHIRPGSTTGQLDSIAEEYIRSVGAVPSFKGYNGFPASTCICVNDELVHGIPGRRVLQEGDLLTIDIGACYRGFHGDSAWTYPVGKIDPVAQRLLDVTEQSLMAGLAVAVPGNHVGDIGVAVQGVVEDANMAVVLEYAGHGIGRSLHESPNVPNVGSPGEGPLLRPGMVIAIEPMVNLGSRYVYTHADGWTVSTVDGEWCAHFEHTVAITTEGSEILTQRGPGCVQEGRG